MGHLHHFYLFMPQVEQKVAVIDNQQELMHEIHVTLTAEESKKVKEEDAQCF